MVSLIQRKTIGQAARGRRAARWPLARTLLAAVFVTLFVGQLAAAWARVATDGGIERYIRLRADFRAVITGGLMIREGNGALLYDEAAQHEAQVRVLAPHFTLEPDTTLPNSHPPYESLFAAAFGGPPYAPAFIAWTVVELLTFGVALWLLARATPLGPGTRWLCVAGALAYLPFIELLLIGQSSTLVLLGMVGTYAALKAGRPGWAGLALALLLFKPQLAVLVILLLLLARAWRPLMVAAAIHGALAIAAMPILGITWPLSYVRYLAGSTHWDHRMFEYPPAMHNWRGLVTHLVEPLAPAAVEPAIAILTTLTLALVGWVWWCQRGAATRHSVIADPLWALVAVASLLIAHHLYEHDLIVLIFPAWLIVANATARGWAQPGAWLALVVVGCLLQIVATALAQRPWHITIPSIALMATTAVALALVGWHQGRARPFAGAGTAGTEALR